MAPITHITFVTSGPGEYTPPIPSTSCPATSLILAPSPAPVVPKSRQSALLEASLYPMDLDASPNSRTRNTNLAATVLKIAFTGKFEEEKLGGIERGKWEKRDRGLWKYKYSEDEMDVLEIFYAETIRLRKERGKD